MDELGFDAAVDRHDPRWREQLREACPNGVDVDFENVGGEIMDAVFAMLNLNARVPLCGLISEYNDDAQPGPSLRRVLVNRVLIKGFIVLDWFDRFPEAITQLGALVAQGKVKDRHTIVEGLERRPGRDEHAVRRRERRQADREVDMSRGSPPGSRLPGVVQAVRFSRDPIGFLERNRLRYGDVFSLSFPGFGRMVYLADPALVKQVFTGDPATFHAGAANARALEPMLGTFSLLTLDGEDHMRQRKLLLPPFHGEAVQRYRELIAEIAAREVERWPVGEPFELRPAHAGDHARGDPAGRLRHPRGGAPGSVPHRAAATRRGDRRADVAAVPAPRPRPVEPVGAVPANCARRSTSWSTTRSGAGAPSRTPLSETTCSRCCSVRATRTAAR